jgi:hypothetical protein
MIRSTRTGRYIKQPKKTSLKDLVFSAVLVTALTVMTGYAVGHSFVVEAESEKSPLASDYVTPSLTPSPSTTVAAMPFSVVPTVAATTGEVTSESGVVSERDIINTFENADIIHQIYQGESSYGKHDVCRARGMYNGFGYAEPDPLRNGPTCYDSFEKVVGLVDAWITDKLSKGFSRSQMNCYYVRGLAVEDCNTAYKLK